MPIKTSRKKQPAATLPSVPNEIIDQFVSDPIEEPPTTGTVENPAV